MTADRTDSAPLSVLANGAEPARKDKGLLADGRQSRGWIALELEALDGGVSVAALGLLAVMRRRSFVDETDGHLLRKQVDSVARENGITEAETRELVVELERAGQVIVTRDEVWDRDYLAWNISKAERDAKRAKWRERQRKKRKKPVTRDGHA